MKLYRFLFLLIFFIFQLAIISKTNAQCAMCRATIESSANTQQGKGKGVNSGILYLMVIPYLMAAGIGYFWYKQSTKETAKVNFLEKVLKKKLT
ncbi:MAG: hypothetical protein EAZ07_06645 [Cytophagales bacterium]|nr:MAG: hypothetical protein EAZ07_06645 [Cytophagales bacterium]